MDCFDNTTKIIGNALNSIDEDEFCRLKNDCLETINQGNKIIATGIGKNVPICEKFVGTLNSLGISASFMHGNSAIHGDLGMIKDGDL